MMLALGFFIFKRQTLPYQTLNRTSGFNWQSNSRVGNRAAFQYLGPGAETIEIGGELYPELTGGQLSLFAVRKMAELGSAWPLINGSGEILGMYVITSVTENGTLFYNDGTPRKINFSLKLTQVDPTLTALYDQAVETGSAWLNSAKEILGLS